MSAQSFSQIAGDAATPKLKKIALESQETLSTKEDSIEKEKRANQLTRLKLWFDLGKFFIGTVLLGLFTTAINAQIQNKQIELERLKVEQEHLSKFVEQAMSDHLIKRIRFAQYFATLTFSEASRDRWQTYYLHLEEERLVKIERLRVIDRELPDERERANNTLDTENLNALLAEKTSLENDVGVIARAVSTKAGIWNDAKLNSRIVEEATFKWRDAIATDGTTRIPTSDTIMENIADMAIKLQAIQDKIGQPIEIIRWYKTPPANQAVGGATYSRHLTGGAVKIRVSGYSGQELAKQLSDWTGGMGLYPEDPSLLHLDNRSYPTRWGGAK